MYHSKSPGKTFAFSRLYHNDNCTAVDFVGTWLFIKIKVKPVHMVDVAAKIPLK